MPSATIRPAAPEDGEILARLNSLVQQLHVTRRPDYFKPTVLAEVAEWFREGLGKPSVRAWIAEEGGAAVGYVLAVVRERPASPFCHARSWCEIDQLAVAPGARRKGVARALIARVIVESRAQRLSDVEANSWSFNDEAHITFRRLGFLPKTVRFEWHGPR